jgi:hypothetical protein
MSLKVSHCSVSYLIPTRQPRGSPAARSRLVTGRSRRGCPYAVMACHAQSRRRWLGHYVTAPGLQPGFSSACHAGVASPRMPACTSEVVVALRGTCGHVRLSSSLLRSLRSRRLSLRSVWRSDKILLCTWLCATVRACLNFWHTEAKWARFSLVPGQRPTECPSVPGFSARGTHTSGGAEQTSWKLSS